MFQTKCTECRLVKSRQIGQLASSRVHRDFSSRSIATTRHNHVNKNKLKYTGRINKLIRPKGGLWRIKSPAVQLFPERIVHGATHKLRSSKAGF